MDNLKELNWPAIIASPLVILLIAGGLWFSVSASVENYKIGRASDQVLGIVSRARDLRFLKKVTANEMRETLIDKLVGFDGMSLALGRSNAGKQPQRGVEGPWGGFIGVQVSPNLTAMRLHMSLPSVACRKMLTLFSEEAMSMGLVRVDMKDQTPSALWRLVYEESDKAKAEKSSISSAAIDAGCGHNKKTTLSLMFKL